MDVDPFDYNDEPYATETYGDDQDTGFDVEEEYGSYGESGTKNELVEQYQQMKENPIIDEPLEEILESRIDQLRR